MSDPKRLLDEGSPFLRSVLGSLDDEAPPRDLDRKILAAMAAVPTATASASATASATTSAAGATTASSWLRPRAIFGAVAAVGVGVALVAALGTSDRLSPASDVAPAPVAPPARVEATSPPPLVPAPETTVFGVSPDSLPTAAPTVARPPATPSAAMVAPSTAKPSLAGLETASIEREVQLLDHVKAALGSGSAASALGGLDAYDAEFPRGTLKTEATVLRVRALLLGGDRAGAEAVGEAFLASQPNGVHAKRIRVLLGK